MLLADDGSSLSTELRSLILRISPWRGLLQLSPFIDVGLAWNSDDTPDRDPNPLVGVGLGLLWRQGDRFSAQIDWGIPLVSIDSNSSSWQEDGLYFAVLYSPF